MMFIVLVLISGFLGFYIGQRNVRKDSKYNLLLDEQKVGMVSYQTQQE